MIKFILPQLARSDKFIYYWNDGLFDRVVCFWERVVKWYLIVNTPDYNFENALLMTYSLIDINSLSIASTLIKTSMKFMGIIYLEILNCWYINLYKFVYLNGLFDNQSVCFLYFRSIDPSWNHSIELQVAELGSTVKVSQFLCIYAIFYQHFLSSRIILMDNQFILLVNSTQVLFFI